MDYCEFLAEDRPIEIIPKFTYSKQLNLITGDYGPFVPGVPVKVPLWMATNLYRQNKCTIIAPEWIHSLKKLTNEQDRELKNLLPPPDDYWRETLKIMEQEFGISVQCRDLIDRREAILKSTVQELFNQLRDKETIFIGDITLNNATPAELYAFKQTLFKSFQEIQALKRVSFNASQIRHHR